MTLLVLALALVVGGGVAALLASRWPRLASALAVLGVVSGGVVGEVYAFDVLRGSAGALALAWQIPYGQLRIGGDALSAFFLVPLFGLSAVAAIYGRAYMAGRGGAARAGFSWLSFNALVASMAMVVAARQAVLFLVAWEVMSLSAYFLVTFEHERAEVRRAGWIYLVATHAGVACLMAMFLLLRRLAGSFDFDVVRASSASPAVSAAVFVLAFVGFGVKAGFVPLHVWLPEAHAAAPSHVSAVMSGVMIKVGLYGLLRVLLLLGAPAPWWGPVLMAAGLASALYGISLALYQRDMKRVLAYSSIENMGLILLGLGTGLWGAASHRPIVAALATSGALLHVWNHSMMKGLMFMGAGSVLHGTGTKDLEQLGGVARRMPRTGLALVVGAVAIAGLPPLNGFVSEWLVYLGLVHGALASSGPAAVATLLAVGALSLAGGLAALCFVRLIGTAMLGTPRTEPAREAHESPPGMTAPLLVLAAAIVAAAFAPRAMLAAGSGAVGELAGGAAPLGAVTAPLSRLVAFDGVLLAVIAAGVLLARLAFARRAASDATWGCGYAAPSARMQYTARSFAELVSEHLLPRPLRARRSVRAPTALFPEPTRLTSEYTDPVSRGFYEPFVSRWGDRFARLRWLQQGVLPVYLLYIVLAALLSLGWISLRTWSGR